MRTPGVLLFQNDVLPEADSDFNRWHQHEHVFERLAVPGFQRMRRYRAVDAQPVYMVIYDCDDIAVLASKAYKQCLDQPTEWTKRLMPSFRNTLRSACHETWSTGRGTGGGAILVHCRPTIGRDDDARHFIEQTFAPPLMQLHHVVRIALWESNPAVIGATQESMLRPAPEAVAQWVLFIETIDLSQTMLALHSHVLSCASAHTGLLLGTWAKYQLIFECSVGAAGRSMTRVAAVVDDAADNAKAEKARRSVR